MRVEARVGEMRVEEVKMGEVRVGGSAVMQKEKEAFA